MQCPLADSCDLHSGLVQAHASTGELCADPPIPHASLASSLDALAAAILAETGASAEAAAAAAAEWAQQTRAMLTETLDGQLRAHRPRLGMISETARRARSIELLEQRRRLDTFVAAQTQAVNKQACALAKQTAFHAAFAQE